MEKIAAEAMETAATRRNIELSSNLRAVFCEMGGQYSHWRASHKVMREKSAPEEASVNGRYVSLIKGHRCMLSATCRETYLLYRMSLH